VSHYYDDPWAVCHIIMMTLELCVTFMKEVEFLRTFSLHTPYMYKKSLLKLRVCYQDFCQGCINNRYTFQAKAHCFWTLCHIIMMIPELCITLLWWPLNFVSHYYDDPWALCHIIIMTLELCVTLLWWLLNFVSHYYDDRWNWSSHLIHTCIKSHCLNYESVIKISVRVVSTIGIHSRPRHTVFSIYL
jgi:uncharacterized protein with PQ loop repeat